MAFLDHFSCSIRWTSWLFDFGARVWGRVTRVGHNRPSRVKTEKQCRTQNYRCCGHGDGRKHGVSLHGQILDASYMDKFWMPPHGHIFDAPYMDKFWMTPTWTNFGHPHMDEFWTPPTWTNFGQPLNGHIGRPLHGHILDAPSWTHFGCPLHGQFLAPQHGQILDVSYIGKFWMSKAFACNILEILENNRLPPHPPPPGL